MPGTQQAVSQIGPASVDCLCNFEEMQKEYQGKKGGDRVGKEE